MASSQSQCKWLPRVAGRLLAVGLLCICFGVLPVTAQQAGQGIQAGAAAEPDVTGAASLGEVTIIGSRIPRSSVETARPVVTLDAKQLAQTGLVNVGEILQHITSAGSAINSKVDVGGNGGTNLDLRNLGTNRVLVLVNGKRWITGLRGAVDLDQIPTSVIESVEVL